MARHLRVEFPGAIYHATCRMIGDARVDGSRLFTEDEERERFVERLGERVEEYCRADAARGGETPGGGERIGSQQAIDKPP